MPIETIRKSLSGWFGGNSSIDEDYLEIDVERRERKSKIVIRSFILRKFEDINDILAALREGYTIAVVDIKQLKSRDIVELKRAISKIKKTVEAMDGSVAGFGENTVIATPSFAEIYKPCMSMPSGAGAGMGGMPRDSLFEE